MWNIEARRAEVDKVPRGVGYGEGVSTLDLQMVTFGAFCWFFSTIQLPVLHAKTGAFGLPKFAVVIHCCLPS